MFIYQHLRRDIKPGTTVRDYRDGLQARTQRNADPRTRIQRKRYSATAPRAQCDHPTRPVRRSEGIIAVYYH